MLLDISLGQDLWVTFGTPLLVRRFVTTDDLNHRLAGLLLAREAARPELRTSRLNRSNLGGWRSEPDLLSWPEPEIAELKRMMQDAAGQMMQLAAGPNRTSRIRADYQMAAWANINRDRSYNVNHSHPDNHWSGVYYVSIGEADPDHPMNGVIEFQDPRGAATALPIPGFDFGFKQTIQPQPGMMVMFPSWHIHMVHPFYGRGERISIAFNIRVSRLEVVPAG